MAPMVVITFQIIEKPISVQHPHRSAVIQERFIKNSAEPRGCTINFG